MIKKMAVSIQLLPVLCAEDSTASLREKASEAHIVIIGASDPEVQEPRCVRDSDQKCQMPRNSIFLRKKMWVFCTIVYYNKFQELLKSPQKEL